MCPAVPMRRKDISKSEVRSKKSEVRSRSDSLSYFLLLTSYFLLLIFCVFSPPFQTPFGSVPAACRAADRVRLSSTCDRDGGRDGDRRCAPHRESLTDR